MTNKETPSKKNTSVILYYSSSEGIHIEEPQETHKFRPEAEVLLYGSSAHYSWFQDKLLLILSSILP